jgi:hypothetical protein
MPLERAEIAQCRQSEGHGRCWEWAPLASACLGELDG